MLDSLRPPRTAAHQASLSFTISQSLLKLMAIESVMPSKHVIFYRLLLLPSILPRIRVFTNESTLCVRLPKYWTLSFSISSSNEYSGLISFRIDWFDLLAVLRILQGSSRVSQFESNNSSALGPLCGPTFTSIHDYWKNHALWTFVSKTVSLLFNMLSRFVIAFLPRSKHLLISWLQLPTTVILESKKIKYVTVSIFFPIYLSWRDRMSWSSCFEYLILSQFFHSPLSPSSRGSLVPLHFLSLQWCYLHIWECSGMTSVTPHRLFQRVAGSTTLIWKI